MRVWEPGRELLNRKKRGPGKDPLARIYSTSASTAETLEGPWKNEIVIATSLLTRKEDAGSGYPT